MAVASMLSYYGLAFWLNTTGQITPLSDMLVFRLAFLLELFVLSVGWLYQQRIMRRMKVQLEKTNQQQSKHLREAQTDLLTAQETERRRLAQRFKLTPTEVKIISLIRQGLSTPQIGEKLFVGTETVKSHRKNIFRKLNITHLSELLDFANKHGL